MNPFPNSFRPKNPLHQLDFKNCFMFKFIPSSTSLHIFDAKIMCLLGFELCTFCEIGRCLYHFSTASFVLFIFRVVGIFNANISPLLLFCSFFNENSSNLYVWKNTQKYPVYFHLCTIKTRYEHKNKHFYMAITWLSLCYLF